MTHVTDIQKALDAEKLIVGTDIVLKKLKNGEVQTVYVTANAPELVKTDVIYYAKLANIPVIEIEQTNEDLKEICKKKFLISLVAVQK